MSIKLIDTEDNDYVILDFIRLLKDISFSLDTLGQIQSCASGLSMENRASKTFERKILLDTFIAQIENNRRRDR